MDCYWRTQNQSLYEPWHCLHQTPYLSNSNPESLLDSRTYSRLRGSTQCGYCFTASARMEVKTVKQQRLKNKTLHKCGMGELSEVTSSSVYARRGVKLTLSYHTSKTRQHTTAASILCWGWGCCKGKALSIWILNAFKGVFLSL